MHWVVDVALGVGAVAGAAALFVWGEVGWVLPAGLFAYWRGALVTYEAAR